MSEREELAAWAEGAGRLFGPESMYRQHMERIAALLREPHALPEKPPEGFVRVRAAVLLSANAKWGVYGFHKFTDESAEISALNEFPDLWDGPHRVSFVTIDAPLPAPPAEIVGTVTP